ncbi:MAG TPA: glycosyltransferase family 39 protein [Acidimicrobiales bacterium]
MARPEDGSGPAGEPSVKEVAREPASRLRPVVERPLDQQVAKLSLARAAPWLLFLLTVGLHLLLAIPVKAPVVHEDEFAYLYAGHYLALGGPPLHTHGYPGAGVNPGYSLLLVPLWWFSTAAYTVYREALVINALLAGITAALVYALAGRLAPKVPTGVRAIATAVVVAYPSFLVYSNLVTSENLLIPGFLVLCLAAMTAFSSRRPVHWAVLGVLGGLLYLVHPRGLAVVIALVLVAAWVLWPWRVNWPPLAAFALGLVASLTVSQVLVIYANGGVTTNPGLFHVTHAGDYPLIFYGMSGSLLYLLVGTAGLFALGIWAVTKRAGAIVRGADGGPEFPVVIFIVVSLIGVWLLASLVDAEGVGIGYFINGRYDEGVLAPILLLGVLLATQLTTPTPKRPIMRMALTAIITIAVCAFIVAVARRGETHAPIVTIETIGVDPVLRATHLSLNVVALAIAGVFTTVASLVAWRRGFLYGVVVVVILFIPSAITSYGVLVGGSTTRATQRVVPETLVELHQSFGVKPTCVAYDLATNDPFFFYNDRLFDPSDSFSPFDSGRRQRPCSDLVVSGRLDLANVYPGARLLVREPHVDQDLWVLPGALQDQLINKGRLSPMSALEPSPRSGQKLVRTFRLYAGPDAQRLRT